MFSSERQKNPIFYQPILIFFPSNKESLNLGKHNENGITIQFYAMLITALLQLKLKQDTVIIQNEQDTRRSGVRNPDPETEGTDMPDSDKKVGLPDTTGITNADIPSDPSPQSQDRCDTSPGEVFSHPYQFFEMIGEKTDKYWKIGVHRLTTLRQILQHPFDDRAIEILGSG